MQTQEIGVIGLGVMGQNLALNIERNGFSVAGFDLDSKKVQQLLPKFKDKNIIISETINDFINSLKIPRKILLMVPAGKPVDDVISAIRSFLQRDDIIIDAGNSFYRDTDRRSREFENTGLKFIGTGVSGGEQGALLGPCIMPGGTESAYRLVEPILTKIAAQVDGIPCCAYIGPGSAGHFVKMVHNAIEYGDMQIICEAYDLMKTGLGMPAHQISDIFAKWNEGVLNSYLIEITIAVLRKTDEETGNPLVDVILDTAEQKGTGKWAAQVALDLGVAIPTLAAAVEARILSSMKQERLQASEILSGGAPAANIDKQSFINKLEKSLYLSKIICYAQGMSLLRTASNEYSFNLRFNEIAQIWKGGCVIRARLLETVRKAYENNPQLTNLLVDEEFSKIANETQHGLREIVSLSSSMGIPVLAFNTSLAYYDSFRSKRLPANLLQGQRDYFGAHTYRRIDKEGIFHTQWE